jgi:hypothetical protein
MSISFKFDKAPSFIYMQLKKEDENNFDVFVDGILQENVTGISLVHNKDEYNLNLSREIGFN